MARPIARHSLSDSYGNKRATEDLDRVEDMLSNSNSSAINIAIVGSPNVGKSSLINQIVSRPLLSTSALPDDAIAYIQSSESQSDEAFRFQDISGRWRPLKDFSKDMFVLSSIDSPLLFSLDNDWLRHHRFCLIEMPPLNVSDREIKTHWLSLTCEADCLLLVTDASAPMRRSEVKLLEVSAQQSIPTVVIINKIDRLMPEDYDSMAGYVSKFAKAYDETTAVITFSDRIDTTQNDIQRLRKTVESAIARNHISAVRAKKSAYGLVIALDAIAAELKAKLESPVSAQKKDDIQQKQYETDMQNLEWLRIKQKLNARRRKVDGMLRVQLQSSHTSILNGLLYELDTTEDFREWWRRDFTARLTQEIQQTAEQVTAAINRQVVSDIEWLQAEAYKQFDFPLEAFDQPDAKVDAIPTPQKSLVALDENASNLIARIGAVAAAVLASVLSKRVGYRNAELAASVVTEIATEHLIAQSSSQEKVKIRAELSATIQKIKQAYRLESTRQLEESYSQIIVDLQRQQSKWQQTQSAAIETVKRGEDGRSEADLQYLLDRTQQLKADISTVL